MHDICNLIFIQRQKFWVSFFSAAIVVQNWKSTCACRFLQRNQLWKVFLPHHASLRKKDSSQFLRKSNILKGNVFASLLKARLDKKYSSHFARKYFELKVSGNFLFHFTFLYLYFFLFYCTRLFAALQATSPDSSARGTMRLKKCNPAEQT